MSDFAHRLHQLCDDAQERGEEDWLILQELEEKAAFLRLEMAGAVHTVEADQ